MGDPVPRVRALERAAGKSRHAFLPLRHPMSHLRTLIFREADRKKGLMPWSLARWREAIMICCTLPLCSVDLSSPWDPILTASDSSGHGIGVSEAVCTSESIAELARASNFRGDYTTLIAGTGTLCLGSESQDEAEGCRFSHICSVSPACCLPSSQRQWPHQYGRVEGEVCGANAQAPKLPSPRHSGGWSPGHWSRDRGHRQRAV